MPAAAPTKKPYLFYVKEAILSLKERTGSSIPAIKKYIASTYPTVVLAPVSI